MEITVTYNLNDAEVKRLKAIQAAYKEKGDDRTLESLFSGLMLLGCKYDIAEKLDFAEKSAGVERGKA